jgi:hypothetical protein
MASLEILLDRRNRWEQVISLELFTGVKDIFRDQLPQEASRKQNFMLTLGSVTPVPLFEFELKELFVEATVKSGCKWWLHNSRPSHATVQVRRSFWFTVGSRKSGFRPSLLLITCQLLQGMVP